MAPVAYVSQPLWAYKPYAQNAYKCPDLNMYSPSDGTPIICTAHTPSLFYRNRGINQQDPGKDLAGRIRTVAEQYEPPFFVTVYGGLSWQPGTAHGKTEFWALLHSTMASLNSNGTDFVAIGASEMARLAKAACNATGAPAPATAPSCVKPRKKHAASGTRVPGPL